MSEISERLYAAIVNKGYSYGELAKLTGIPKSAIQRYAIGETEKIPIDRLELLASSLGVSSAYLMGWEDDLKTLAEETVQHNEIIEAFDSLPPELRTYALNQIKELARLSKSQDGSAESQ